MALDKIVDSAALDAGMTSVADSIRAKAGIAEPLVWPDGFKEAIEAISGGIGDSIRIYMAQVTPETNASYLAIQHNLATTDILLAMCAANTLGDIIPTFAATLGKMWCKTGITNNRGADGFSAGYQWDATNNYAKVSAPNTASYFDKITDDNTFTFNRASSGTTSFLAGLTYDIIIIAANAGV